MDFVSSTEDVGRRLRAFRMGAGLTPEELAIKAGVSRAAIYRYESGKPPKVDTLGKIADLLGVSLPTLLGVGVEYIASAISFFERMRQMEEDVDQITVMFGPISYLLTTDRYDELLPKILDESIPQDVRDRAVAIREIGALIEILKTRKETFRRRSPSIVSLVSAAELEDFGRVGFVGAHNPPGVDLMERQAAAHEEIRNIVRMLREQPIGVQIGVVIDSMPGASFQVFKRADRAQVAVSPFRLGSFANIRVGVATITAAAEAVQLYGSVTDQLWRRSLKGDQAADFIEENVLHRGAGRSSH
ncbi:helix-turn-helix transcriptional regulator [Rhizobium sp. LC145]|uniref:helix-turn-helix domain-containing protein n=1 Tax=Rhizobium sp. LC145 TaxID=1120688 RepID=UPI000629EB29|nr:helix-turn-helix transcriptional regulator [Rhizobium sp. LC145]KKX33424.1 DNA-binding protein [Rhizobium sp. LC145]TKT58672.1 helix-turn-helix transcriptional regulator [Rhizobiaceae bacterium LC148]